MKTASSHRDGLQPPRKTGDAGSSLWYISMAHRPVISQETCRSSNKQLPRDTFIHFQTFIHLNKIPTARR